MLMAHVVIKDGQIVVDPGADGKRPLPSPDSVKYVLRDSQGRVLAGDPQLPAVALSAETSQLIAMAEVDHRSLRRRRTLRPHTGERGGGGLDRREN